MFLGRTAEYRQLNHYYDRKGSQILVVYGQRHIGKTTLVREFAKGRPMYYYMARSCSDREQLFRMGEELLKSGIRTSRYPSYTEIFETIAEPSLEKKIIILDEFQYMVKTSPAFMQELAAFVQDKEKRPDRQEVLVILCSSSVGWVENSMVRKIGEAAYALSGLLKIKEMRFTDMKAFFPAFTKQQCMEVYAVLGGIPGLWVHFRDKLSVKENIIRHVLAEGSFLNGEAERYVAEELRETSVYNTILAVMAGGKHKLNDLHLHTGFSRAKISVYLKNLMELEIAEKVFSYDTEGKANAQKGVYRISNHFVYFYFRFIYPHLSRIQLDTPEEFYREYILPSFRSYVSEYFKKVCLEYLDNLNRRELLPITYERSGEWVGKAGNIDIVAQDEAGSTLIALCNYDASVMPYEDYEWLLFCAEKAHLEAGHIYLFTGSRFDERLVMEAKRKENLTLLTIRDL